MSILFIIASIRDKHLGSSQATAGSLGLWRFILGFMKLIKSQAAVITELIMPHMASLGPFYDLSSKQQSSFSKGRIECNYVLWQWFTASVENHSPECGLFFFFKNKWSFTWWEAAKYVFQHKRSLWSFCFVHFAGLCMTITTLQLRRKKNLFHFLDYSLVLLYEAKIILMYFMKHSFLHIMPCSDCEPACFILHCPGTVTLMT